MIQIQDSPMIQQVMEELRGVNFEIKEERLEFLRRMYPLIHHWEGMYPNFRHIIPDGGIELLLSDSINYFDGNRDYTGAVFIAFVALTGYKEGLQLDTDGKPLLHRTTPVHLAVKRRAFMHIDWLLRIYDNVNYTDEDGYSHFHAACQFGCYDAAKSFLELGQDPNCPVKKTGDSPLHLALTLYAEFGNAILRLLLENGANPNLANKEGFTPLHVILKRSENIMREFFEMNDFFQQTVYVDAQDKLGNTPLHVALNTANPQVKEIVEFLLRRGASPNLANGKGLTPLHIICKRGEGMMFGDYLVELFFGINDERHQTVKNDARDKSGNTPLHVALRYGNRKAAELLLRRGADPNLANGEGLTPMQIIFKRPFDSEGHMMQGFGRVSAKESRDFDLDLLNLLFEISAEMKKPVRVNARDKFGQTPLQWAVVNFLPHAFDALLSRGANLSSFVFPTESDFDERFKPKDNLSFEINLKLRLASGALAIVERLEKEGHKLNQSNAMTIMKLFAKYELFEKSADPETDWHGNGIFTLLAQKIEVIPGRMTLYDLILRPEEAETQLTYADYFELAQSREFQFLPEGPREACALHICETMSRGFFRRCALDSLMKLTRHRLSIECCDRFNANQTNEDLYNICLAAKGRRSLWRRVKKILLCCC
ncbi:hypothetical protein TKK_0011419 [Trichogramma kaykai]|uniref:Uncharacterized protein n=1 Tax=Trichogramma kaykai TaxID=54128 RepID=A0ABD2WSF4_9HYME